MGSRLRGGGFPERVAAADRESLELTRLRDALRSAKSEYWSGEVEVSRLGVAARRTPRTRARSTS